MNVLRLNMTDYAAIFTELSTVLASAEFIYLGRGGICKEGADYISNLHFLQFESDCLSEVKDFEPPWLSSSPQTPTEELCEIKPLTELPLGS